MEAATTAAVAAASESHGSGYRLKFNREGFLQLLEMARPRIIYRRGKNYLFAFDGFVMYSQKCNDEDFMTKIIYAIARASSATTAGRHSTFSVPPIRDHHRRDASISLLKTFIIIDVM